MDHAQWRKKTSVPQRRTSEVNEPVHVASEANVLVVPPVPVRVQTRNKMELAIGGNSGGEKPSCQETNIRQFATSSLPALKLPRNFSKLPH